MLSATVVVCSVRPTTVVHAINAILSQSMHEFELLIIDQSHGGGTKQATDKIGDPRIKYVADTGIGVARARNLGLKLATGSIVCFVDDDCVPKPDWLEHLVEPFKQHPALVMAAGTVVSPRTVKLLESCERVSVGDAVFTGKDRIPCENPIYRVLAANLAFRKNPVLSKVGWFDVHLGAGSRYPTGEELDLVYRILQAGLTVATTSKAIVEHTHGIRSGSDYLRHKRSLYFGAGGWATKYQLSGDQDLYRWVLDRLSPIPGWNGDKSELLHSALSSRSIFSLKSYAQLYYYLKAVTDCHRRYTVDKARMVLIPKWSTYEHEYAFLNSN